MGANNHTQNTHHLRKTKSRAIAAAAEAKNDIFGCGKKREKRTRLRRLNITEENCNKIQMLP
jgi:hypothetical protein